MAAIALTIAGSDSGGGAGIQADIKTFSAFGVYACSVVTAVTAQNTRNVSAVHMIPGDIVAAQIGAVLTDIRIDAIKIGMLGDADIIGRVADALAGFSGPVILDPVMIAKSGTPLLPDSAVAAMREFLLPRATVLTPNIPEAAKLLGEHEKYSDGELRQQAHALLECGPQAVLMKGGHGRAKSCTDWLVTRERSFSLKAERLATRNTHGTGCTYSAAITAGLAKAQSLATATRAAHGWLHQAIRRAGELNVGSGHGPVHHFHGCWK